MERERTARYADKAHRVADKPDYDRAKLLLQIVTIKRWTRIKERTITMSSFVPKMSETFIISIGRRQK